MKSLLVSHSKILTAINYIQALAAAFKHYRWIHSHSTLELHELCRNTQGMPELDTTNKLCFRQYYVVTKAPKEWQGTNGRRKILLNLLQYCSYVELHRSPSAGAAFMNALLRMQTSTRTIPRDHSAASDEISLSQELERNEEYPSLRVLQGPQHHYLEVTLENSAEAH